MVPDKKLQKGNGIAVLVSLVLILGLMLLYFFL